MRRSRWLLVPAAAVAVAAALIAGGGSATAAARAGAASVPSCSTSGLVIWLGMGNGTAGSTYYQLFFTNLSGRTCSLRGFPGVSAVNLAGGQVGVAASRDHSGSTGAVTLASGRSAAATLRIVDAGAFPRSSCAPVTAAGLRVYPPNQRASKLVPYPFQTCSRTGEVVLNIRPLEKA